MDSHQCHHHHKNGHSHNNTGKPLQYTCPMHPEIQQDHPGACPKCGMALEASVLPLEPSSQTEYSCPMHPEVVRNAPGNCPKCGMVLEPRQVKTDSENLELINMSRRFWVSLVLSIPVFVIAMLHDIAPDWFPDTLSAQHIQWF